jgi:dTDP-4-dehydrorhamnose reductase
MKLLITGGSGLYGSKLAQLATSKQHQVFSAHNQHPTTYGHPIKLDITNKAQVEAALKKAHPDVVVHAASLTDVDKCELNPKLAMKINVKGTDNIVQACKKISAFLLFISTDYVFNGEKGCYTETDLPSPINYYGNTKLKAEERVKTFDDEYCIARTSVIYGATPAAGKTNFALWLLDKLKKKEQANVFTDQWNSPTLNTSLAEMTLEIVERKLTGIYHLSGATRISRHEFAILLAKTFKFDTNLIIPTLSTELSFPAKRPHDSSLNTLKAQQTLANQPLQMEVALKKFKAELNQPSQSAPNKIPEGSI